MASTTVSEKPHSPVAQPVGSTLPAGSPLAGNPRTDTSNSGGSGNKLVPTITESTYPEALARSFSRTKRWTILFIIFVVQVSMNLNVGIFANAQAGIATEFGRTYDEAAWGAGVFLITYAFGCELWAPWSEELGRKYVLQASLGLVNLMCFPVIFNGGNFNRIVVARAFGGVFSAGGSVTLGVVSDLYSADRQEAPLAFIVLSSVAGSIVGPILGGFLEANFTWRSTIWAQFVFGVLVQAFHFFFCGETRSTVLLDRHAAKLRKLTPANAATYVGPTEHKCWKDYFKMEQVFTIWLRPFKMLLTEPIVFWLSLLSGFSDALIFMMIQSFGSVMKDVYKFTTIQAGLAFLSFGFSYVVAYGLYLWVIKRNRKVREQNPGSEKAQYESRLWWLLWCAPLLTIGLFMFAFVVNPAIHWIFVMVACLFIGVANYTVYMTTIDYMVKAYGEYSASATGGNGFMRDLLAGILTFANGPYWLSVKKLTSDNITALRIGNVVWAAVSVPLVCAVFYVYIMGPRMRLRSSFAQKLAHEQMELQRSQQEQQQTRSV
ncbi:major facilitator superfamily domain-containing protein [Xylariaceae sp. FL1272]|nr:major facilitator superfamily domain-containing protein [Xylariaceae sp. FL1272]